MRNYKLEVQTGHYFISPLGFISYSEDFYEACCSHSTERSFSPVRYYLICHSIELSLKAFLLLKGVSRDDLMKKSLGHNLHAIFRKTKELGILSHVNILGEQESELEKLNKWYSRKGFEYFEIKNLEFNSRDLPPIKNAQEFAKLLIDTTAVRLIRE